MEQARGRHHAGDVVGGVAGHARERCDLAHREVQVATRDRDGARAVHVAVGAGDVAARRRQLRHPLAGVQRGAVELVVERAVPAARRARAGSSPGRSRSRTWWSAAVVVVGGSSWCGRGGDGAAGPRRLGGRGRAWGVDAMDPPEARRHDGGGHECGARRGDDRAGAKGATARRVEHAHLWSSPSGGAAVGCCHLQFWGTAAHHSRAIRTTQAAFRHNERHKRPEGRAVPHLVRSLRARRGGVPAQRAASTSSAELAFNPGPGSTASQLTTPSSMMAA